MAAAPGGSWDRALWGRGLGTIFKINPDGTGFAVLHRLTGLPPDGGILPMASLVALGGVFHGATPWGGTSHVGTIYRINPDGSGFALLRSFVAGWHDGACPNGTLVTFGGTLFGFTSQVGPSAIGAVFKVNRDGSGFVLLHSFMGGGFDGAYPNSLIAADGVLYGTTFRGGAQDSGTIFKINPNGSGFALLHWF